MLKASFLLPEEEGLSFYFVEGKCVQQCGFHIEYTGQEKYALGHDYFGQKQNLWH